MNAEIRNHYSDYSKDQIDYIEFLDRMRIADEEGKNKSQVDKSKSASAKIEAYFVGKDKNQLQAAAKDYQNEYQQGKRSKGRSDLDLKALVQTHMTKVFVPEKHYFPAEKDSRGK